LSSLASIRSPALPNRSDRLSRQSWHNFSNLFYRHRPPSG